MMQMMYAGYIACVEPQYWCSVHAWFVVAV